MSEHSHMTRFRDIQGNKTAEKFRTPRQKLDSQQGHEAGRMLYILTVCFAKEFEPSIYAVWLRAVN